MVLVVATHYMESVEYSKSTTTTLSEEASCGGPPTHATLGFEFFWLSTKGLMVPGAKFSPVDLHAFARARRAENVTDLDLDLEI